MKGESELTPLCSNLVPTIRVDALDMIIVYSGAISSLDGHRVYQMQPCQATFEQEHKPFILISGRQWADISGSDCLWPFDLTLYKVRKLP